MATLQEFEAMIGRLSRLEIDEPIREEGGRRLYPTDVDEAIHSLLILAATIRRIAWSGPYQAWARELAAHAEAEASRLQDTPRTVSITTDHPASARGLPTILGPAGEALDQPAGVLAVRNRLGITQAKLAEHCGVSVRTVQDWEQGRRPVGAAPLNVMADLLRRA